MELQRQRHAANRAEMKKLLADSQRDGERIRALLLEAETRDRRRLDRHGE